MLLLMLMNQLQNGNGAGLKEYQGKNRLVIFCVIIVIIVFS